MAADPYAPCPSGSGKKLKFCCSDLAAEIEKVHKMISGDQPRAALKHVEQLLAKQPDRISLLDLRITLELSLKELAAAKQSIDTFLAAHPGNSSAHAQAAIYAAATDDGSAAINALQDALEKLEDEMPRRVLEAIGAVGHALMLEGNVVAARVHLLLYAGVSPEQDNLAVEVLLRMNLQAGLPLLLRDYLTLAPAPDDFAWKNHFEEALRISHRGLWRRAESSFAKLREQSGPVPALVYNLALLRGWLGHTETFCQGLHEFAALDTEESLPLQPVEAEALAQLVDSTAAQPTLDVVRLIYPIQDADALSERFAADGRIDDYAMDPSEAEEETQPRSTHVLLDGPVPVTGIGLTRQEVPNVLAFVAVHSKRTDREAQLEVTTDRDDHFQQTQSLIKEIAADSIGDLDGEELISKKSMSESALSWRWRLPNDTPPDHRRALLAEQRREAILEHWSAAAQTALGGKSPQEARGVPELNLALRACVLIVEQAAGDPRELAMFDELREQLDLPFAEPIDPADVELEHVPLVRVPRMLLAKIDDDPLAMLLDRTVMIGANLATLVVATELADRESPADGVDLATAFRQLIRLEQDTDRALQWIGKARCWSQSKDQSAAEWALMELELSIERQDVEAVQRLLTEIREEHVQEPGVAEAAYRLLLEVGLIAPPDVPGQAVPSAVGAAQSAPEQRLWTPDQEPVGASEAGKKPPAIWTPS